MSPAPWGKEEAAGSLGEHGIRGAGDGQEGPRDVSPQGLRPKGIMHSYVSLVPMWGARESPSRLCEAIHCRKGSA